MKRSLRIGFFGPYHSGDFLGGSGPYWRGIARSLAERGHEIILYEPSFYEARDVHKSDFFETKFYFPNPHGIRRIGEQARNCDLIIKFGASTSMDEFIDQQLLSLKSLDCKVMYWDLEPAAQLRRLFDQPEDYLHNLIPQFDAVLLYLGNRIMEEAYMELGANMCFSLIHAIDPTLFYPVYPEPGFEAELAYLGHRTPAYEQQVWELFFKPATVMKKEGFLLCGNGWEDQIAGLTNVRYLGQIYTRDYNAFHGTPKAILNVMPVTATLEGAGKMFEAAAAGGCVITMPWDGLEQFFMPGRDCLLAKTAHEIISLLQNTSLARCRTVGRNALKRILAQHTFTHRAAQIEDLFYSLTPANRHVRI